MRLLFVDDEPEILAGLRRLLYDLDDSWTAEFVTSGTEALALMAQSPFDVVVSDMRMPGMDGVGFLEQVQRRHPKTIRMVLSGQTDEITAIRALSVAHQFLSKPFEANLFCALVEQTANLTNLMQDCSMRQLIGNLSVLPPVPELYAKLTRVLQQEESTAAEVVSLIQRDPTMSAKILQLANSAFFARRLSTADLHSAVMHLGTNTIRHLVLTVELFDQKQLKSFPYLTNLDMVRDNAIRMASIAEQIAAGTELSHEAFTMGLLADIGQLVFAITNGLEWNNCQRRALTEERPLQDCEFELFGISHAEVGAFLLGIWGLPFSVVEAVAHHHHPHRIAAQVLGPAAVTAIAAALVDGTELDEGWLDRIGAKQRVFEIRARMGEGGNK